MKDASNTKESEAPVRSRWSVPLAALSIAGSDSGGGAGIQADLRTFAAHRLLGTTAITAITAQNTRGVSAWEAVSPGLVTAQIEAVLSDLPVRAAKTGMLANAAIIEAVATTWERLGGGIPLVVDPVMVSTSGHRLLDIDAERAMIERLLPLAAVLTPNRPEASALTGLGLETEAELLAERLAAMAPRAVIVIKGGHRVGTTQGAIDLVRSPDGGITLLEAPWVETTSTHGTGCTLSAAIAANLALGRPTQEALARAKDYLSRAITNALPLGHGHGPVDHLHVFDP